MVVVRGFFHMLCNIEIGECRAKKGGRTNMQFPIFLISYLVCGKHSLDSIIRPGRESKLMWSWRASYPSKVNGGQIKTTDIHELVYIVKKKNMSVDIMLC